MIAKPLKIICAGLIGWDTIGRTNFDMIKGNDLPGKIETSIGGVAANIAVALANHCNKNTNFEIILLSSTGNDKKSDLLLSILAKHNKINCNNVLDITKISGINTNNKFLSKFSLRLKFILFPNWLTVPW